MVTNWKERRRWRKTIRSTNGWNEWIKANGKDENSSQSNWARTKDNEIRQKERKISSVINTKAICEPICPITSYGFLQGVRSFSSSISFCSAFWFHVHFKYKSMEDTTSMHFFYNIYNAFFGQCMPDCALVLLFCFCFTIIHRFIFQLPSYWGWIKRKTRIKNERNIIVFACKKNDRRNCSNKHEQMASVNKAIRMTILSKKTPKIHRSCMFKMNERQTNLKNKYQIEFID